MKALPILISIPHGGTAAPRELEGRVRITVAAQFADSDPFTAEIYDIGESALRVVKAEIARAYVDLNRSKKQLPPGVPDGLIKSVTCYGEPVYMRGMEPDPRLVDLLIKRYYDPYYDKIEQACTDTQSGLRLCLDCHSMAPTAPPVSGNSGSGEDGTTARPLFCLSNRDGTTCPDDQLNELARCIAESFGIPRDRILLNRPFRGGHITEWFGGRHGAAVPWVQVEMNRVLYLDEQWFDRASMRMTDKTRLAELNRMFRDSLVRFFAA